MEDQNKSWAQNLGTISLASLFFGLLSYPKAPSTLNSLVPRILIYFLINIDWDVIAERAGLRPGSMEEASIAAH